MRIEAEQFDNRPKVKPRRLNILPNNPEIAGEEKAVGLGRFPSWLHRPLPKGNNLSTTNQVMRENRLHTVCEEAKCPNLLECWSKKTATFLIMGKECSRSCGFCDIAFTKAPPPLDPEEPAHITDSVKQLGLKHVVITMVARDDLEDGGAEHFAKVVSRLRCDLPEVTIEALTSDFEGNFNAIGKVLDAHLDIYNHNIETVRSLTPRVRHKATYERTLSVLQYAKAHKSVEGSKVPLVKSGMMVGLGETEKEVFETLQDLKEAGCDILTMGQYLQPSRNKLLVKSFVTPETFKKYEDYGYSLGIKYMYCGPFVRSSYNANLVLKNANGQEQVVNTD